MVHSSNLFTEHVTPEFPVELKLEFQWSGEGARDKPGPAQGACALIWGSSLQLGSGGGLHSPFQLWRVQLRHGTRLAGGLGLVRARHDQHWTRWSCSEALFLLQQLLPGPGSHYRLDARVTCPVGTMGNLGVDKSSDFPQDKQLARSGDRTCAQMSQLEDLFPGAQCVDVRSG